MKSTFVRRSGAMMLALVMCMVFTLASALEVDAASTKTFYVVSSITDNYSFTSSESSTKEKTVSKYTYDKNGLETSYVYGTGKDKTKGVIAKRNKKGYVTQIKYYVGSNLKYDGKSVITVKSNGDVTKSKRYDAKGKLTSETKITYWKKSVVKKRVQKDHGEYPGTWTYKYDKKGGLTKESRTSKYSSSTTTYKNTYNKKGDITKQVGTETSKYGSTTEKTTIVTTTDYTYDKKGNITKQVSKSTTKDSKGKVLGTSTSTYKNTYNKRGDITKSSYNSSSNYNGYKNSSKLTSTYKYKAVKVPKKYWKLFKK